MSSQFNLLGDSHSHLSCIQSSLCFACFIIYNIYITYTYRPTHNIQYLQPQEHSWEISHHHPSSWVEMNIYSLSRRTHITVFSDLTCFFLFCNVYLGILIICTILAHQPPMIPYPRSIFCNNKSLLSFSPFPLISLTKLPSNPPSLFLSPCSSFPPFSP